MWYARAYLRLPDGALAHTLSLAMVREYRQAELFLAGAPGYILSFPGGYFTAVSTAWPRDGEVGMPWDQSLAYADAAVSALRLTDFERALDLGIPQAVDDVVYYAAALVLSSSTGAVEQS